MNDDNKQIADITSRFSALVLEVDRTFAALKERFSEEVRCGKGCDDCCHAVFSVSYVEAWVIRRELAKRKQENEDFFARLQERGLDYDREKAEKQMGVLPGRDADSQVQYAKLRLRCPMLEDAKQCAIYEVRPLTCRIYGLPLSIEGKGHVCGFSGFTPGKDYPTIKMENIHSYLADLSRQLAGLNLMGPGQEQKRYFLSEIIFSLEEE